MLIVHQRSALGRALGKFIVAFGGFVRDCESMPAESYNGEINIEYNSINVWCLNESEKHQVYPRMMFFLFKMVDY